SIQVEVRYGQSQAITVYAPVNPGLFTDIHKAAVVVAQQFVPGLLAPFKAEVELAKGVLGVYRMVEQVHIQVPVQVVVKKDGIGAVGIKIQSIFPGAFGKGAVPIVDIQFVVALEAIDAHHGTDIDVQKAVPIDIGHGRSGVPTAVPPNAGLLGNVLEFEIAQVPVQPIGDLVAGKEYIGQAVIVDIPDGHPAPIVKIEVVQNAEAFPGGEGIGKLNSAIPGIGIGEQASFPFTGGRKKEQGK